MVGSVKSILKNQLADGMDVVGCSMILLVHMKYMKRTLILHKSFELVLIVVVF